MISGKWFAIALAGFAVSALIAEEVIGWQSDCSSTKDWYDNKVDPGFGAKIEQAEPSVIKVTQDGKDTWGKVAFVVKDVNIDATPNLEAKINKVDQDAAFKIGVAPLDWSELFVVIPRSSADGIHKGDIKAASGWTGKKSFNVVIIVEGKGKAVWVSDLKISSAK